METSVADLFSQATQLCAMIVTVIVAPSLVVGLIVSMFQAATQINEQTLSFLPRLLVTMMTLVVVGPWLGMAVVTFTEDLIARLASFIH